MQLNARGTPQQLAQQALAAGCQVVFTTSTTLSATYGLDQTTQNQIGGVVRDAAAGLGLPFGASTFTYNDVSGAQHTFTAAQLQELYKGLRDYLANILYFQAGVNSTLPTQPVTVNA